MTGCEKGACPAIVVVDYHKGNLSSVERGLVRAGGVAVVTDDPDVIRSADALVLPGVGSFYDAMEYMRASGQAEAVCEALGRGVPFLGICLGFQLLFERGEEGVLEDAPGFPWTPGLGVLPGSVVRMKSDSLKVPHVGWNQLDTTAVGRTCPLLAGVERGSHMYFTHSYVVDPATVRAEDVAATTDYTLDFPSVVWRDAIFGCQFHPEKSSTEGLAILRNFVSIVKGDAR